MNDHNMMLTGMQTTATNKSEAGSDLNINQIHQIKISKLQLEHLEEEKASSGEEADEMGEAGEITERGTRSPRSKLTKRKNTLRANSRVKKSLYKETESTKVKKQEKFELP